MDVVEEIKSRLGVEEVVGSYIQLKPAGRNLKGLCPFHHEKTPSFMVSPDKGIWHCFGCSSGGDIFEFVQKMDGLDFRGALEALASKAGLPAEALAPQNPKAARRKAAIQAALELSTKYFQAAFVKSRPAQEYAIKKRGLNKETLVAFRIGYAPHNSSGLTDFLRKQGVDEEVMVASGVVRKGRGGLYDMFRGRLMLPLADKQGQTAGFTGRLLANDAKDAPKYINTPATLLYDKSRLIYGWHLAKEAIRDQGFAVLVEGNMDVVTSHQAGFKNVVAVSGTALSSQQLKELGRIAPKVVIAFDADSAGVAAAERAIELAQSAGKVELMVAELGAKDPDELIKQDPKLWQKAIKEAPPALEWLLKTLLKTHGADSAGGKKAVSDRYLATLVRLEDAVEQEHYLKLLSQELGASPEALAKKLAATTKTAKPYAPAKTAAYRAEAVEKSEGAATEEELLVLAVAYPDTRPSLDDLSAEHFTNPRARQLFAYLKKHPAAKLEERIPQGLQSNENYVKMLQVKAETSYPNWAPADRRIESFSLAQRLEQLRIKKAKQNLTAKIKAAEAAGDSSLAQELLKEYQALVKS